METLLVGLYVAGAVQLLIASVNFFLPGKLDYHGNLARLTPIMREIFLVQAAYIVFVLAAFAGLCFAFAPDLAGGSPLGRALSAFLAVFWGARFFVQLLYYEPDLKRRHPVLNVLFMASFLYLTGVFAAAALA